MGAGGLKIKWRNDGNRTVILSLSPAPYKKKQVPVYILDWENNMKIRQDKANELLHTYCAGNYNRFGRELGIDPSHVHRYLTTGIGGGRKLTGAIMKFSIDKGLNFQDYIEM
jgi:hypothetical protein